MYKSHAQPYAGYRGIQATTQAIETYFCWTSMQKDIHDYVSQCLVHQKVKYDRGKAPRFLQPLPIFLGDYFNGFHLWFTKIHTWKYGYFIVAN